MHAPMYHRFTTQKHTYTYGWKHRNITTSFCAVTKPATFSFLLIRQASGNVSFHRQDGQVPGTRHQQRTCSQRRSKEKEIRNSAYMQDSHILSLSSWELQNQNENKDIWKNETGQQESCCQNHKDGSSSTHHCTLHLKPGKFRNFKLLQ